VDATLYGRRDVARLGVAPLTSMYLHGTFRSGGEDDFRPRVHDSEGLLMETGRGEWIWRPLTNRQGLRITSLRDVDPWGFGLVQRTRDFGSYLDLEARYDLRPSQWVIPDGDWGPGGVELVEFPTVSEFNDNVVAYWSPDGGLAAGEERGFRYRLETFDHRLRGEALGRVVRTRVGWDGLPGEAGPASRNRRRVVLDFQGGPLDGLTAGDSVTAVVQTSAGSVSEVVVLPLPEGGRRATFAVAVPSDQGSDLRVFLERGDAVLTETWSYLLEVSGGR
jgi:glucans biosynthesis protein